MLFQGYLEVGEGVLHAGLEDLGALVDGVHLGVGLHHLVDVDVEAMSSALPQRLVPGGLASLVARTELQSVDCRSLAVAAHFSALGLAWLDSGAIDMSHGSAVGIEELLAVALQDGENDGSGEERDAHGDDDGNPRGLGVGPVAGASQCLLRALGEDEVDVDEDRDEHHGRETPERQVVGVLAAQHQESRDAKDERGRRPSEHGRNEPSQHY